MDQPRGRTMRFLALGAALIALAGAYLAILRHFRVSELPSEQRFGAVDQTAPAAEVYLEAVSIDALNGSMQVRAALSRRAPESESGGGAANPDLRLLVDHDKTRQELNVASVDHTGSSTFEIGLNGGSVAHYPLDSYVARLTVQLVDGKSLVRLPARITMWDGLLGYDLHTTSQPGSDPNIVQLTTTIARSGAFALFALCAYGAMVVLGCCAIVVGVLTFSNVRPPETSLIGSLAAIAFALPVLRNALPGSPPLGVEADMWVFLWTELVVVLALALVIFKWATSGPKAGTGGP